MVIRAGTNPRRPAKQSIQDRFWTQGAPTAPEEVGFASRGQATRENAIFEVELIGTFPTPDTTNRFLLTLHLSHRRWQLCDSPQHACKAPRRENNPPQGATSSSGYAFIKCSLVLARARVGSLPSVEPQRQSPAVTTDFRDGCSIIIHPHLIHSRTSLEWKSDRSASSSSRLLPASWPATRRNTRQVVILSGEENKP